MVQVAAKIDLTASDVTGQKQVSVRDVSTEYSVGEMIDNLLPRMQLHQVDRNGAPVHYDARLERETRHLHRTERVGDALQSGDHLVMHPRIHAGGKSG